MFKTSTLSLAVLFAGSCLLCNAETPGTTDSDYQRDNARSLSSATSDERSSELAESGERTNVRSMRDADLSAQRRISDVPERAIARKGSGAALRDRNDEPAPSSMRRDARVDLSEESSSAAATSEDSDFRRDTTREESSSDKPAKVEKGMFDKSFAKSAALGNATEIAMGKLAIDKATNPRVKEFGETLVKDHGGANDKLLGLDVVKGWNITLPTDQASQKAEKMMSGQQGADFDSHFIHHMIRGHEKNVAKYQEAIDDVKNDELKAYAQETLPVIKEHLRVAKSIATEVGEKKGSLILSFIHI